MAALRFEKRLFGILLALFSLSSTPILSGCDKKKEDDGEKSDKKKKKGDDEDDDAPKKKGKKKDEDEGDAPKKKSDDKGGDSDDAPKKKKADDDDGGDSPKKKKPDSDETAKYKLPTGVTDSSLDKLLASGGEWAAKEPVKVPDVAGLRVPGGGEYKSESLGKIVLKSYHYTVARDKVLVGLLTLLAEDNIEVLDYKSIDGPRTFGIIVSGKRRNFIIGAPKGSEETEGNLMIALPDGGGESTPTTATPPPSSGFAVGNLVDVNWKGSWYKGKILGVKAGPSYLVSYDGYAASWNEWVSASRVRSRR